MKIKEKNTSVLNVAESSVFMIINAMIVDMFKRGLKNNEKLIERELCIFK
ncbi:hypothetical protein ES703_04512 [subsurface metagenome]